MLKAQAGIAEQDRAITTRLTILTNVQGVGGFLNENWISPMIKTRSSEMKIEREKGYV